MDHPPREDSKGNNDVSDGTTAASSAAEAPTRAALTIRNAETASRPRGEGSGDEQQQQPMNPPPNHDATAVNNNNNSNSGGQSQQVKEDVLTDVSNASTASAWLSQPPPPISINNNSMANNSPGAPLSSPAATAAALTATTTSKKITSCISRPSSLSSKSRYSGDVGGRQSGKHPYFASSEVRSQCVLFVFSVCVHLVVFGCRARGWRFELSYH